MKAMVKRDSATVTAVDLGEGEAAQRRLQNLIDVHGKSAVTVEGAKTAAPVVPVAAATSPVPRRARASKTKKTTPKKRR